MRPYWASMRPMMHALVLVEMTRTIHDSLDGVWRVQRRRHAISPAVADSDAVAAAVADSADAAADDDDSDAALAPAPDDRYTAASAAAAIVLVALVDVHLANVSWLPLQ